MNIRLNAMNNYANAGKIANVNNKSKSENSVGSAKATTVSDSIFISSGANEYSEITKTQSAIVSDVNSFSSAEYVQSIKEQVRNGEYNISSEQLAGRILDRFA